MGIVTILPETTKNPITLIGKRAGICQDRDIYDDKKNYKRGLNCINSMHGRTLEYVNVEMIIDGYSARVIREYYTHIGGQPSRLQSSTRYINYDDFEYVVPASITNSINKDYAKNTYESAISNIKYALKELEKCGIPREDIAMLLPLGMTTKIVDKRNLRNLVEMSHQRKCTKAYWEFRELFRNIENALREYSDEWIWIVENLFQPKCGWLGYCSEKKSCGNANKKNNHKGV